MAKATDYEQALVAGGFIKYGEFTAHNGEAGNCKVELDELFEEDGPHVELANGVTADIAEKLRPYKPEIVIPIPDGANRFGEMVGRKLGTRVVKLAWRDKENRVLEFEHQHERIVVCLAGRIALIDDVFRTGSAFADTVNFAQLNNKEIVGGVVWDRSDRAAQRAVSFPVEAVVTKFLPLMAEKTA